MAKDLGNFRSFWSSASPDKLKGSGVGLLIHRNIEQHIGKIERFNEYLMCAYIFFKKCKLLIIVAYIPPSDETCATMVIGKIQEIVNKNEKTWQIVIMGDFNRIPNKLLDKSSQTTNLKRCSLFTWMEKKSFVNAFRRLNPRARKYTWSNGHTSTRIDQIWLSENLMSKALKADIIEMGTVTGSDHELPIVEILLDRSNCADLNCRAGQTSSSRMVWKLDKATKENWDNYRTALWNKIKKNLPQWLLKDEQTKESYQVPEQRVCIDQLWDIIEAAIWKAAIETLPKKKVQNKKKSVKKDKESSTKKVAKEFGRLIKSVANNKNAHHMISSWNNKIKSINSSAGTGIPNINLKHVDIWLNRHLCGGKQ